MEFEIRDENIKLCQRDKTDQASACLARNYKFKKWKCFCCCTAQRAKNAKKDK
jgi:hypothetical protein